MRYILGLLVLLATPVLASDLSLSLKPVNHPAVGSGVVWQLAVTNPAAETARELLAVWSMPDGSESRRAIPDLAPGETAEMIETFTALSPEPMTMSVRVGRKRVTATTAPTYQPSPLTVWFVTPEGFDEAGDATYRIVVRNDSSDDVQDVRVVFLPDDKSTVVRKEPEKIGDVPAGASREIAYVTHRSQREGHIYTSTEVRWWRGNSEEWAYVYVWRTYYRYFTVTNTADSGTGSLRQSMLNANADCGDVPCMIDFNIATDEPFTIRTSAALPRLFVPDVTIDATTARAPVDIDGGGATIGNGVDIVGRSVTVRGLSIHGFSGSALMIVPLRPEIRISVTISRNTLYSNQRGMVLHRVADSSITGNEVSTNARSGVFLASADAVRIENNRLFENGASGIYLDDNAHGNVVRGNVIFGNSEFGVAIGRSATRNQVLENSIYANREGGIDHGLDGPTLTGVPTIASATYKSGTTVIKGRTPSFVQYDSYEVLLFVNSALDHDGSAEGERYLGTVASNGEFTFTHSGSLSGYITGVLRTKTDYGELWWWNTSEFSPPVPVN